MIKKQDMLAMWITFVTGLMAGGYLYVVGFAPQIEKVSTTLGVDDQTAYEELTIIANRYGGCERLQACDSFQVRSDGTYSYLPGSVSQGATPQVGSLPSSLVRELERSITMSELEEAAVPVSRETCDSYIDKNDFRYEITFEADVYNLDTCRTDFSHEMPLGVTLDKLWMYFTTQEEV